MCFFRNFINLNYTRYGSSTISQPKLIKMGNFKDVSKLNYSNISKLYHNKLITYEEFEILKSENKSLSLAFSHNGFLIYKDDKNYFIPMTTYEKVKQYSLELKKWCGLDPNKTIETVKVTDKIYFPLLLRDITDLINEGKFVVENLGSHPKVINKQLDGINNFYVLQDKATVLVNDPNIKTSKDLKVFCNFSERTDFFSNKLLNNIKKADVIYKVTEE